MVPCGTTGESATMTEAEDQRVIAITVEVARGRARVIAGTGSNSTAAALNILSEHAIWSPMPCCKLLPVYNKPTQEGCTRISPIAEAVPETTIMLYKRSLSHFVEIARKQFCVWRRLRQTIVAIKEASGNFSQIMEILREPRRTFECCPATTR